MRARLAIFAILAACANSACSKDPRIDERPLYVYAPHDCAISENVAYAVIYAGGDFEPSQSSPPIASFFLDDVGVGMTAFPQHTRAVVADISQSTSTLDWRGLSEVGPNGPINVLAWPGGSACRLSQSVERRIDTTIGVAGNFVLVAGGNSPTGGLVPHSFVADLGTGHISALDLGLRTRRGGPTVTSFTVEGSRTGALVAAGFDPDSPGTPLDTAEIYQPTADGIGDFDRTRVELSEARLKHGAATMADGSTLLVGGLGTSTRPLRTMEIVDPKTKQSRSDGLALLAIPRVQPSVLRLASGEILIAGGLDASENPISTLEWFAPDATHPSKRSVDLVTGSERAFVPLEAGGALAVIAPPPGVSGFKTVWVISADGSIEAGVPLEETDLAMVRLFPGAEGAPVLWTGKRWYRWEPWFGSFSAIADAPTKGPSTGAMTNGDSGLAMWLEDQGPSGMFIVGYRFATHTRFQAVPKPLLVTGPEGLAPDRLAGTPASSIRFVDNKGLVMGPGASAFVTDATFASVSVTVDVVDSPPEVVLRQEDGKEIEIGGAGCGFGQTAKRTIAVERRGSVVTVIVDDGVVQTCPATLDPDMRVSIGVRGGTSTESSGARNLRINRL